MTVKRDPFKYFKTSPEIIRLALMMYVLFPLYLRNVEDLLHERGMIFAMKLFGSGEINLVQCSRQRSAETGSVGCDLIRTGNGVIPPPILNGVHP